MTGSSARRHSRGLARSPRPRSCSSRWPRSRPRPPLLRRPPRLTACRANGRRTLAGAPQHAAAGEPRRPTPPQPRHRPRTRSASSRSRLDDHERGGHRQPVRRPRRHASAVRRLQWCELRPTQPFTSGETVTVTGTYTAPGRHAHELQLQFVVAAPDVLAPIPRHRPHLPGHPARSCTFNQRRRSRRRTRKGLRRTTPHAEPGGDIFFSVYPPGGRAYAGPQNHATEGPACLVLKPAPDGHVRDKRPGPAATSASPSATRWWDTHGGSHGFGLGQGEIYRHQLPADRDGSRGATASPRTSTQFELTPSGTALITAWKPLLCDLISAWRSGRARSTTLVDAGDRCEDRPRDVTQWHPLDHVPLADSHASRPPPTLLRISAVDWFHMKTRSSSSSTTAC